MRARPGFTLIEIIVVTVMIALLALVLVTRLSGAATREFDLASDRVSDLLLMYAIRSEFADEPVGIRSDPEQNLLQLVIRRGDRDEMNDGWERDPSVPDIRLPTFLEVSTIDFRADGDPVDPSDRPLTSLPGQPRPRIDVILTSSDPRMPREVHLVLPPNGWRPVKQDSMRAQSLDSMARTEIDLDTTGRWQEDW